MLAVYTFRMRIPILGSYFLEMELLASHFVLGRGRGTAVTSRGLVVKNWANIFITYCFGYSMCPIFYARTTIFFVRTKKK